MITHCSDETHAGLTPSDFPLAALNQAQLDGLGIPAREIEDILPLAPMQQGILLHSLLEQGNGIYLMQDQYDVGADVDFEAFKFAWQQVVQRHPALRTAFHGLESGVQRQIVMRRVPSPVQLIDLSHLSRDAAEAELDDLLNSEREQGFDFARAPLLRLRLIKFGEADFRIVQSHHHALIDAWCRGLMLTEFFAHYRAFLDGRQVSLPPARPYRDFLAWLAEQDEAVSRDYWRNALAGFTDVTPLPYRHSPQGDSQMRDVTLALGTDETAKLAEQARQHRLTANTFVQAAWALLLMRHADRDEVLFGVTVAGRPTELRRHRRRAGPVHQHLAAAHPPAGHGRVGAGPAQCLAGAERRHAPARTPVPGRHSAAGRHPPRPAAVRQPVRVSKTPRWTSRCWTGRRA